MRPVVGRAALSVFVCVSLGGFGCSGESSDDDEPGSSGVPSSRYLDEMTPDEQRRLCEWAIAEQGGPGEKTCSETTTVTTPTVEDCSTGDFSDFHCMVSSVEECIRSLDGDACRLTMSAACAEYIECALDGGQ